ncbi:MAG: hypothetical protein B7Y12_21120 [Rhizobiales bacterium 24-66-13]|jgi:hypothetical protein|nr:MAG: hypothetical protein B7Y61_20470 [Rhizobiales bacterium 35-66-30]OYZ67927.1 MAG: hypothetical protein B7Y12_21120 [Rhizobiales bacterium 24-66-13]OZA95881.1 MAG: hypothetical protein B7X67_24930 [Rhizobiales bacterium 39-66-18]HQS07227.1 hypothetical protein [Xanthobacteraceae bacterium]
MAYLRGASRHIRAIVLFSPFVMAGLVPAIHAGPLARALKSRRLRCRVDARGTPVHDEALLQRRQAMKVDRA